MSSSLLPALFMLRLIFQRQHLRWFDDSGGVLFQPRGSDSRDVDATASRELRVSRSRRRDVHPILHYQVCYYATHL